MSERGVFISFEGGEGAGKSTQIRALAAYLGSRGVPVTQTREPGGTPLAEAIRALLLGPDASDDAMTQALLFAAARREHIRKLIEPALQAGGVVLCDRFTDSTRAYQGGRLPITALEASIVLATGGLKPDLTILLDIAPEAGLARARSRSAAIDTFEQAGLAFHAEVRARFLALAGAEPRRFAVIDAGQDEKSVAAAVVAAFEARLGAEAAGLAR